MRAGADYGRFKPNRLNSTSSVTIARLEPVTRFSDNAIASRTCHCRSLNRDPVLLVPMLLVTVTRPLCLTVD